MHACRYTRVRTHIHACGSYMRTCAARRSSRSHAIFTVCIHRTMIEVLGELGVDLKAKVVTTTFTSKFHLVDLAGEEARPAVMHVLHARSWPPYQHSCLTSQPSSHHISCLGACTRSCMLPSVHDSGWPVQLGRLRLVPRMSCVAVCSKPLCGLAWVMAAILVSSGRGTGERCAS